MGLSFMVRSFNPMVGGRASIRYLGGGEVRLCTRSEVSTAHSENMSDCEQGAVFADRGAMFALLKSFIASEAVIVELEGRMLSYSQVTFRI